MPNCELRRLEEQIIERDITQSVEVSASEINLTRTATSRTVEMNDQTLQLQTDGTATVVRHIAFITRVSLKTPVVH